MVDFYFLDIPLDLLLDCLICLYTQLELAVHHNALSIVNVLDMPQDTGAVVESVVGLFISSKNRKVGNWP